MSTENLTVVLGDANTGLSASVGLQLYTPSGIASGTRITSADIGTKVTAINELGSTGSYTFEGVVTTDCPVGQFVGDNGDGDYADPGAYGDVAAAVEASQVGVDAAAAKIAAQTADAKLDLVKAKTDLITATNIQIVSSVITSGQILPLVSGDDYSVDRGAAVTINVASMPDRTDTVVKLHVTDLESDAEVFSVEEVSPPDDESWIFEPTAEQTELLERAKFGRYQYAIIYHYTDPDDRVTKAIGGMVVRK